MATVIPNKKDGKVTGRNTAERWNVRVCVETEGGRTLWIPESRLEAWEKADHSGPLTQKEREFLQKMKERVYGSAD